MTLSSAQISNKSENNKALALIALALGLLIVIIRIIFIFTYETEPLAGGDGRAYWSYAQQIVKGNGFRSALEPWLADRPPLYSYFLAAIFFLGGENESIVFIVQAILGGISAGFFMLSAVKLLGTRSGILSGLLFGLLPHFLIFTQQVLTESIYIPIWVFLLSSLVLPKPSSKFPFWASGIFLGLLSLIRREALMPGAIITIVFLLLRFSVQKEWRKVILNLLVIFGIAGVVMAPWLIRNTMVFGKPLMSSSGGYNFMVGNNPLVTGGYHQPPEDWSNQFKGLDELSRNDKAWELSFEWIKENPNDWLKLIPMKLKVLWGGANNLILDLVDLFLIPLYIFGIIRNIKKKPLWLEVLILFLIPILTTTFVGAVFVGAWRYRQIVYPGLLILAGYGIKQILEWIGAYKSRSLLKRESA